MCLNEKNAFVQSELNGAFLDSSFSLFQGPNQKTKMTYENQLNYFDSFARSAFISYK